MAACIIPFRRPALPDGHPDQTNLTRFLSERRNRRETDLDELRCVLRGALDEGAVRRSQKQDEILTLLRRIDRRLAKISAA